MIPLVRYTGNDFSFTVEPSFVVTRDGQMSLFNRIFDIIEIIILVIHCREHTTIRGFTVLVYYNIGDRNTCISFGTIINISTITCTITCISVNTCFRFTACTFRPFIIFTTSSEQQTH